MRVIAGSARSLPLKCIEGLDTRPTTDRIKETLFNMLGSEVCDCRFLDLFAGSGAIGIEALSRGAAEAVFVEKNPRAIACIRDNLAFTKLLSRAQVIRADVFTALQRLTCERPFDLIFLDPPYRCGLEEKVLEFLSASPLVEAHTRIIVEASLDTEFSYLETLGYEQIRYKKYKTNAHVFIRKYEGRLR